MHGEILTFSLNSYSEIHEGNEEDFIKMGRINLFLC